MTPQLPWTPNCYQHLQERLAHLNPESTCCKTGEGVGKDPEWHPDGSEKDQEDETAVSPSLCQHSRPATTNILTRVTTNHTSCDGTTVGNDDCYT